MTVKQIDLLDELKTIEKDLQEIVTTNEKEISQFKDEVMKAQEELEELNSRVIETKDGNDPKAYSEAVDKQRTAKDILEFYDGKLEELTSKPMISKEEYNQHTARIKRVLKELNNEKVKQAQEVLKELPVIEAEMLINIDKGNELLATLQHEVYKDDASIDDRSGGRVRMEHLENRYKDYELTSALSSLLNTPYATSLFNKGGSQ